MNAHHTTQPASNIHSRIEMCHCPALLRACLLAALLTGLCLAFPAVPELEQMFQALLHSAAPGLKKRRATSQRQRQPLARAQVPMMLGTAELEFAVEFQQDSEEEEEEKTAAAADSVTVDEPLPRLAAQYDQFFPGRGGFGGGGSGFGTGGGYGMGADTVNFDFQCKCQAKSALARTLNNPLSSDPNQAAQQQIQQLQEQVRKLQEQINRSQQGKSSFEQFAQMLALADGLDCNCSGQSTPWMGWPSGVGGNPFGSGRGGGALSQVGGQFPSNGHFLPPHMMGGMGARLPMGMGGAQFGGGVPMAQQQLYPGYPLLARRT